MQTTWWYVFKRWGGPPSYRHPSYELAVIEAQRLIDQLGGEYEILEAKAVVKPAPKYVVEPLLNQSQIMDEQDPDYGDGIPF